MPQFVCIGAPQFIGQSLEHRTEIQQLRDAGFMAMLGADYVEIQPAYEAFEHPVSAVNHAIAQTMTQFPDHFPILLASDCVSALGMVKGLEKHDDLGVVWYDAHGDFNTPDTTPSGFLGGMPLAAMVGKGNQELLEAIHLSPVPDTNIIATDFRDLDPEEEEMVRASKMTVYWDVNDLSSAAIPNRPHYVHLDVDILDPKYMPALGYPAENGPDVEAVNRSLRHVGANGNVVGLLVSLWNADKVQNDIPLQNTLSMIMSLLNALE